MIFPQGAEARDDPDIVLQHSLSTVRGHYPIACSHAITCTTVAISPEHHSRQRDRFVRPDGTWTARPFTAPQACTMPKIM
jgi:hypothetical protein